MNEWWLFGGFILLFILALMIVLFPLCKSIKSALILMPVLAGFVFIAYWRWGAFPEWINYQQQRANQKQVQLMLKSIHGPDDLVKKLLARLKKQPDSAEGWYLLGRLYVSQNQWQQAHDVFVKAHTLNPDEIKITVNYAESLWQLNHQAFNEEIRGLFQSVLQKNKNQPDALAMLAMDAFLGHAYRPAIDYWQRLQNILPPQSEDAKAIRKAIAKAQQRMNE